MSCYELEALRLGLMSVLGTEDRHAREHAETELEGHLEGPIEALANAETLEQIERHRGTILVAVPAVLRTMAHHEEWEETDLSSLRFVKSGGGPCRETIVRAWQRRGVDFSQGYGLTEIGPNNFAMPDDYGDEKVASVGKPVFHANARVVGASIDQYPSPDRINRFTGITISFQRHCRNLDVVTQPFSH